jgi:predicted AlkP superfamily phosphohydrolase/phosphomutase
MSDRRLAIIGLDCADPVLIFDQWLDDLPNLKSLVEKGYYGELESTIPAITVPAWMSMMTSKDPGQLGFYGFRNRKDHSYDGLSMASSRKLKDKPVWNILGEHNKKSMLLGIPMTYPPNPINGWMVTSFLAPGTDSDYTYPSMLKKEIQDAVGEYIIDVRKFRTDDKEWLLGEIHRMTETRFRLARHFAKNKPWDLFAMVEMGIDRIHHGFWKYYDPQHPKFEPGNKYQNAIHDYYVSVDQQIGELMDTLGDETDVMVVSDHGVTRMDGGICINEWLIKEGLLTLKQYPQTPVRIEQAEIDWSKTRAWAFGGYYTRVFLNVKDREPEGLIPSGEYENVRRELMDRIIAIPDHEGRDIGTKVFIPEEIYREVRNIPPDLIVYLGDLSWRSLGTVGTSQLWSFENDTGPDDANHAQMGMFILKAEALKKRGVRGQQSIYDVAPTILDFFGIEPAEVNGKSMIS